MSDKLAKELHSHLMNASESCGERGWPYNAGWLDFLAGDRPQTDDPVEMAYEAVWYLADCDSGHWDKPKPCVQAAIAFLKRKTGTLPTTGQIVELKALLLAPPNRTALIAWFRNSYPRT